MPGKRAALVGKGFLPGVNRREFLEVLACAATAGLALDARDAQAAADRLYDQPPSGNVHLLHFTDCHAQLLPSY